MREGSRNEKSEQSVGNILLSSQRMTCNGPVGGAASSDSIRFCSSSYAPFFVFQPPILRSQGHSRYILVPRLFFWRGLPFCDKEKACIEGNITLKRVKMVVDNAYVRRF